MSRGHPEDVTVEPATQRALDAMLPAFLFLQRRAAPHGMALDVWDYLAAIYPIARSLRDSAQGGSSR